MAFTSSLACSVMSPLVPGTVVAVMYCDCKNFLVLFNISEGIKKNLVPVIEPLQNLETASAERIWFSVGRLGLKRLAWVSFFLSFLPNQFTVVCHGSWTIEKMLYVLKSLRIARLKIQLFSQLS